MESWPPLPLEGWIGTKQTLHRYSQMVGKTRMALMPHRNHWWHVTLYVDTRGLTTGPMPVPDGRSIEISFDFLDDRLVVTASDGSAQAFDLQQGLACSEFYERLFAMLASMGVDLGINTTPYDLDGPDFPDDDLHHEYNPEAVRRFWTVLRRTTDVLNRFASGFNGKQSPPQLFWHGFDLAMARYSGKPAPPRPGADPVTAEAYSHEVISFGFWAGDNKAPRPAFYSYTAPAPPGLTDQPLSPDTASWDTAAGTAYLAYDDVRASADPAETLTGFYESAYLAGAKTAGWDLEAFTPKRPSG